MDFYLGLDTGTGSVRAALFDRNGKKAAHHSHPIQMWKPRPDYAEQSSEDIWQAAAACTREVLALAGVSAGQVKGIGFDATCSLVLLDSQGQPVSASPSGRDEQNIIVWMDHRALLETDRINNAGDFPVFASVGGKISPEMQIPKLLWIKNHLPQSWKRAAHFFDLPDYLTYRATGSLHRSICSTACKWTYLPGDGPLNESGWCRPFFDKIGLTDLANENYRRIGKEIRLPGEALGSGLTPEAARDFGLLPGTAVGVSLIDAHAGGLGMVGMKEGKESPNLDQRLALIGGTSSCHMAMSHQRRMIPGVWGPYWSAMVPELWLNEGGQSATGALIDHVVFNHAATREASEAARERNLDIYQYLNAVLEEMAAGQPMHSLTSSLHLYPDFHGNRSPLADPHLKGMISGLRLSASIQDLALLYLAAIQAVAYGTRHIIETMNQAGYDIRSIFCCGGGVKNPVFLWQHADITGCRLILPSEPESVLLGSAMLGAVASAAYSSLPEAMRAMSSLGKSVSPNASARSFHEKKYQVFQRMVQDQKAYSKLMK